MVEDKKEGGKSFIKEIINHSIVNHQARLAKEIIFDQCVTVGNISGLNKPHKNNFSSLNSSELNEAEFPK